MKLLDKQQEFSFLLTQLILHAYHLGYEVTLGEAWRSPEEAKRLADAGKGILKSLHRDRLAIDINLYKGDVWLKNTEDYRPLGEYWESLSTVDYTCAWGGRFGDGNHFSIAHGGRK